ncbi:alpha-amylase [Parachitinimonas caeni]|uniref:Alpha-amylase n=1 Tax=Parachitinimonas caeni TaxID=3031301 RepID=A0ABT7DYM6_9NEIS|nr:alpha-amylase family protein [Parachitinimonas caeni]MDK2125163.1 alpha-amylase family protein [Parachitinimonas caeni]
MRRPLCLLVSSALVLTACSGGSDSGSTGGGTKPEPSRRTVPATYRASNAGAAGDAFVHLFEWRWTDVARECENYLGPRGFKAVQVSPPNEHAVIAAASSGASYPWWQRYQPVSYRLDQSRSGTRAEFVDMVSRCKAAGVGIYVDAVINHMTAGTGTGSHGTPYSKYDYPSLYARSDFHTACSVSDYKSAANVQDCELLGLADLDTGGSNVQQQISNYLVELARLGVAGFRIDAAKHINAAELNDILRKVNSTLSAAGRPLPYYFLEVIDNGGEAVKASDYYGVAYDSSGASDITEFKFRGIGSKFLNTKGEKLADLNPARFNEKSWGLMPSDKAVVFVDNHDTQRSDGLYYADDALYHLATIYMLAQPYGYPSIMSGYSFDRGSKAGTDAGPPASAGGVTRPVYVNDNTPDCPAKVDGAISKGRWVCEHRVTAVARMLAFRKMVAGTSISNWWDNGSNAIAFGRGNKGFVAINRESTPVSRTFETSLPGGVYCDALTIAGNGVCTNAIPVNSDGRLTMTIPAQSAIALHVGARLN